MVKVRKGWVEQEFVLLIVAALPSEAGLPNETISYRRLLPSVVMLSVIVLSVVAPCLTNGDLGEGKNKGGRNLEGLP